MAATTKVAPFTYDPVMGVLKTSAAAAALQCSGGTNGRSCGLSWSKGATWDGTTGVGQQMAALEVIQSNLIQHAKAPLTNGTGGTSIGNPNAGAAPINPEAIKPATRGDRIGAGILTAVILAAVIVAGFWINT